MEVYKMRVETRSCNVGEYLSSRRKLKKIGYTVGICWIHLNIVFRSTSRQFMHKCGKTGMKKCLPHLNLYFYWRFKVIYEPNLAGKGVATPPAFFI